MSWRSARNWTCNFFGLTYLVCFGRAKDPVTQAWVIPTAARLLPFGVNSRYSSNVFSGHVFERVGDLKAYHCDQNEQLEMG